MNENALISVVLPVHNRAGIVGRTLDSIASQTWRPLNLIIVDNASTDGTLKFIEEWSDKNRNEFFHITVLTEKSPGASAARNRGLAEVESKYVMFFDSDDEMRPNHIERIARYLYERPETDLLHYDLAIIDDDGWTTVKSVNDENFIRGHILHASHSTQRFTVKTSLIKNAGGWDCQCLRWNDWELGVRLLLNAEHPKKLHGEPTVIVHPLLQSITGSSHNADTHLCEQAIDIIEKQLKSYDKTTELQWLEARRVILAAYYHKEKAVVESRRLLKEVLSRASFKDSIKLHLIFCCVRLTGHGGGILTQILFRPKAKSPGNKH